MKLVERFTGDRGIVEYQLDHPTKIKAIVKCGIVLHVFTHGDEPMQGVVTLSPDNLIRFHPLDAPHVDEYVELFV